MLEAEQIGTTFHAEVKGELVGNRKEDAENRLIAEPAPIDTGRLGGQRCKYAEKSRRYKYDLGHITVLLYYCKRLLVQSVRVRKREREREVVTSSV